MATNTSKDTLSTSNETQNHTPEQNEKDNIVVQTKGAFSKLVGAVMVTGALALGSGVPNQSQAAEPQGVEQVTQSPEYQAFYNIMKDNIPGLSDVQMDFFSRLYTGGLGVIQTNRKEELQDGVLLMAIQVAEGGLILDAVNSMLLDTGVLPKNHPYTQRLLKTAKDIEVIGERNIAQLRTEQQQLRTEQQQLRTEQQQADQRIVQARVEQQQADQRIAQAQANIDFWTAMAERF